MKIIQHEPNLLAVVDLIDNGHDVLLFMYKNDTIDPEVVHAAFCSVDDIKVYLDDEKAVPIEVVND